MSAKILSGTETAKAIRQELTQEIASLKEKHNERWYHLHGQSQIQNISLQNAPATGKY